MEEEIFTKSSLYNMREEKGVYHDSAMMANEFCSARSKLHLVKEFFSNYKEKTVEQGKGLQRTEPSP